MGIIGKTFEWSKSGNCSSEVITKELSEAYQNWIKEQDPITPPETLLEFRDRLFEYVENVLDSTFGRTYYLSKNKVLTRDTSIDGLINAKIEIAKFEAKNPAKNRAISSLSTEDTYEFLKKAIERNYPFSTIAQLYLGLNIDSKELKKPEKQRIAFQTTSQVFWHLYGKEIPTVEAMEVFFSKQGSLIEKIPELHKIFWKKEDRTIKRWIRIVCPVPNNMRKGRFGHSEVPISVYEQIVPIPNVFLANGNINFIRLKFVIRIIVRILKILGWSQEQIISSKFIEFYRAPLKFYLFDYVADWVHEECSQNSSVFDI